MALEHAIRKMAVYLTNLELEHEILSKKKNQFLETFMQKLSKKLQGIQEADNIDNIIDDLADIKP